MLNYRGKSLIQIIRIKGTTDPFRDCQDQVNCSLQSAVVFPEKRGVETNQILFWWKNFYCRCQDQPEEWLLAHPLPRGCPHYYQNKMSSQYSRAGSSEGDIMLPHYFKNKETVTKEVYVNVLASVVKPWMETVASGRPYVFQQDSAPVHTSHLVQNWLSDNIDMFWSKEFWPPNSPDLNPLDYYVWNVVERVTNKSKHPNVTSLRTTIETAFVDIDYTTTCMQTLQIGNRGRDWSW